jgi:predicted acyltransferase
MFWIMGADALGGAMRSFGQKMQGLTPDQHPHGWIGLFAEQLEHVDWSGFRFYDMIFPLFVFIAGVSIVFSLGKRVDQEGKAAAFSRVFRRGLLLYLLGLFYYGGFSAIEGHSGTLADIRLLGVLQRIAICYTAASALFLWLRPRGLVASLVLLLTGYWAMMTFIPVPGIGAGHFEEGQNLTNWIDKNYLPFRKWDGDHDPEGLLSTLPAIGTCLLGVLAGIFLKNSPKSPTAKSAALVVAGVGCLAVGFAWGLQFPIIKKLWTSSFVLVAGGYSLILLGVFHQVVDVFRWRTWCAPFVWIGMNAIFIYMASNLVSFDKLALRFTGGNVRLWLDHVFMSGTGAIVTAIASSLLCIALARLLYTRNAFFRL